MADNKTKEFAVLAVEALEDKKAEDIAIIDSNVLDELYQTIKLMQEINQGITDVNSERVMSLEDAKNKLL